LLTDLFTFLQLLFLLIELVVYYVIGCVCIYLALRQTPAHTMDLSICLSHSTFNLQKKMPRKITFGVNVP